MNSDQYIGVIIEPLNNKDHMVYLQFVALHTSIYGQRLLRIINVSIEAFSTNDSKNLYSKLHNDSVFLLILRKLVDDSKSVPRKDLRTQTVTDLKEILLAFKEENAEYNPNEISIPRKIDTILILLHSMLRDPL